MNASVLLETALHRDSKPRQLADNTEIYSWTLLPPTISIMIVGQRYKEGKMQTEMYVLSKCQNLEFHTKEEISDID